MTAVRLLQRKGPPLIGTHEAAKELVVDQPTRFAQAIVATPRIGGQVGTEVGLDGIAPYIANRREKVPVRLDGLAAKTALEYLPRAFVPLMVIGRESCSYALEKGCWNGALTLDDDVEMRGHYAICENLEVTDPLRKSQAIYEKRVVVAVAKDARFANAAIRDVVIPG
ncbi:MAG: hypothetical protein V8R08_03640 [Coriobacteriales bacterium]